MSKRQVLIILGIWVAILPFLGFTSNLDHIILLVSGLLVAIVAYTLRLEVSQKKPSNVPYVEHKNEPVPASSEVTPPTAPTSVV